MDSLNAILQIPERCLLNKKISKAFFKRNFELTTSERALLEDVTVVTAIEWLASLNPANSNISSYQDEFYTFEEVQVIAVHTSSADFERNHQKIIDLVQKYIPYQIVLFVMNRSEFVMNTCIKKINQNDSTRRIVDKQYSSRPISGQNQSNLENDFIASLRFAELDKTSLKTCYDSYTQKIIALKTAEVSGMFKPRSHLRSQSDIENLERIEAIQEEIKSLQGMAKRESQLNQRVILNSRIHESRNKIEQLKLLITA